MICTVYNPIYIQLKKVILSFLYPHFHTCHLHSSAFAIETCIDVVLDRKSNPAVGFTIREYKQISVDFSFNLCCGTLSVFGDFLHCKIITLAGKRRAGDSLQHLHCSVYIHQHI